MSVNSITAIDSAKAISRNTETNASRPKHVERTESENQKPAPAKQQPATDTVKLSNAAKSASDETKETAAQAAREAAQTESLEK